MAKRTNKQIKSDNIKYIQNQIEFLDQSVNKLNQLFFKYDFKLLWKKDTSSIKKWNESFFRNEFKSVHLIFEIKNNNIPYLFVVSVKSGLNFSYEFARDRLQNHSLRKFHIRKETCDYDSYTCTNLITLFENILGRNIFGFIFTQNNVKNNPRERESAIFYRNKRIILGNIDNLKAYLNEVGFIL